MNIEFKSKSIEDIGAWLKAEGFKDEMVKKFEGEVV